MCCSNYLAFRVSPAFAILISSDLLMLSLQRWRSGRKMHRSPSPWKLSHLKKSLLNTFKLVHVLQMKEAKSETPLCSNIGSFLKSHDGFFFSCIVTRTKSTHWSVEHTHLFTTNYLQRRECVCVCVPGRSLHTLAVGFLPAPGTVAPKKSQVADDAMKLAMKSLIITSNNLHKIVHVSSSSVHCTHINMIHLVNLYLQVWIK